MTGGVSGAQLALSVIVVAFNDSELLSRCLDALTPQIAAGDCELLVVGDESKEAEMQLVLARFPQARFLAAAAGETVPRMRQRGIEHSQGKVVALLEDDCLVGPEWCAGLLAAHTSPAPAIGGAVNPDPYVRRHDWAVYFCEYARFISPFAGPVAALPGNNVSYKRERLHVLPGPLESDDGFHEFFAHQEWQQAGESLLAEPRMAVRQMNRWRREHLTRIQYHHARGFAGIRARPFSRGTRLLRAGMSVGLPLLLVGRIIRALRGRRLWGKFLSALPWILAFAVSWAMGEAVGYLWGAGDSESSWR
jgi:hypothetical protein